MININLATGIYPTGQFPLDAKLYVLTLAELGDLGPSNNKAFAYYSGMKVFCLETRESYIWKTAQYFAPGGNSSPLLAEPPVTQSFTYPAGSVANGVDYSNRAYAFFLYRTAQVRQNTIDLSYLTSQNLILNGSVLWIELMEFRSTVITYRWDRTIFQAPVDPSIILQNLPTVPGDKKVYVFAIDKILNQVIVVEGIAGPNAFEPNVDFARQIRINAVTVQEGQLSPQGLSSFIIYDEYLGQPNEYDGTNATLGTPLAFDYNNDSYSGSLCCAFKSPDDFDAFRFTGPSKLYSSFDSISFYIKNANIDPSTPYYVQLSFKEALTGNLLGVEKVYSGNNGFDFNNPDWHLVNVPKNTFEDFSSVDSEYVIIEICLVRATVTKMKNSLVLIDRIMVNSGIENTQTPGSWLSLTDTFETSYNNKKGFISRTRNEQNGLELVSPVLVPINGCMVRKPNLLTSDLNILEVGDEVYFKKITNGGDPVTLIGHTYDGGDEQLFENYTQNQSIEI
jgi:hypothetical protein